MSGGHNSTDEELDERGFRAAPLDDTDVAPAPDDGLLPLPDDAPSVVNMRNAKAAASMQALVDARIEIMRSSLSSSARVLFDEEYARQVKQHGGGAESYLRTLETFTDRACHNAADRIHAYDEHSRHDREALMMLSGVVASGIVQTENRRLTAGVVADKAIEVAHAIITKVGRR